MNTYAMTCRNFGETQAHSITIEARSITEARRLAREALDYRPNFQPVFGSRALKNLAEVA